MKNCDHCGTLILEDNGECPFCAEAMSHAVETFAPSAGPPKWLKVVKWLFIGLLAAVLIAVAAVTWILNSLGPMPSFG